MTLYLYAKRCIDFIKNKEYIFIDEEEDKKIVCRRLVKEFLEEKELKLEELIKNEIELRELVKILRKYNISFRIMHIGDVHIGDVRLS